MENNVPGIKENIPVETEAPISDGAGTEMTSEEEIREDEGQGFGSVKLKLENFEGPFDLLLTLIEKQSVEITDISISEVTDQYLAVIFDKGGFKVELGSEFLVMAATLIRMKTNRLLPRPPAETASEEMTEEQLAAHLRLYREYKQAAENLTVRYEFWQDALYREQEIIDFPKIEEEIKLEPASLVAGYERAKLRFEAFRNDNKEKMDVILKIEKVSLREKISQFVKVFRHRLKVTFSEMFNTKKNSVPEVVTGFLAVLELNRREKVKLKQNELFGEIEITKQTDEFDDMMLNLEDYDEWDSAN
ncbi:MAG: segregation/condensation protein A [Clostridia bacterium]|nr:segregation/condensation protein A [Clostridia bacterium]MBO7398221.1 segregation/condensation protein A [Clostridia bacterium]MBO7659698.1 segregation/condensation protein A [Clostridia bacterium]MBP5665595.1 segregation/condensation protein A [Clostridia bacterium]MBP5765476.1 segregation/condensation protein A [Clostridia bacterium]